jgi:hypothetical protein
MTQKTCPPEPTNVQRAEWAKAALAVFTAETFSGDRPETMHRDDLEDAISDLICDLLHFARFHPRMDAGAIHARALRTFEAEVAEEANCDREVPSVQTEVSNSTEPVPYWLDAFLDIKRMAEKSGDHEADPFALLDLIAHEARAAINKATKP